MSDYEFTVVIDQDEDGRFVAICPSLQVCYTDGESEDEARELIEVATHDRADGRHLSEPWLLSRSEIAAAMWSSRARDMMSAGVRMRWGRPRDDVSAMAFVDRRQVVIAPRLFRHEGWWIRRVMLHEFGHIGANRLSCDMARLWVSKRYDGDLVQPVVWMA